MSFRDWMKVSVSNAEIQLFVELQRRGLTRHLETQKGFSFIREVDGVLGTIIDFFWNHPYNYAVYLDGPHHKKYAHERRDDLITEALERRGIRVDRFDYTPPLRKRRLKEIADQIEETLKSLGYSHTINP